MRLRKPTQFASVSLSNWHSWDSSPLLRLHYNSLIKIIPLAEELPHAPYIICCFRYHLQIDNAQIHTCGQTPSWASDWRAKLGYPTSTSHSTCSKLNASLKKLLLRAPPLTYLVKTDGADKLLEELANASPVQSSPWAPLYGLSIYNLYHLCHSGSPHIPVCAYFNVFTVSPPMFSNL